MAFVICNIRLVAQCFFTPYNTTKVDLKNVNTLQLIIFGLQLTIA